LLGIALWGSVASIILFLFSSNFCLIQYFS
jgi:hypothetical protein